MPQVVNVNGKLWNEKHLIWEKLFLPFFILFYSEKIFNYPT